MRAAVPFLALVLFLPLAAASPGPAEREKIPLVPTASPVPALFEVAALEMREPVEPILTLAAEGLGYRLGDWRLPRDPWGTKFAFLPPDGELPVPSGDGRAVTILRSAADFLLPPEELGRLQSRYCGSGERGSSTKCAIFRFLEVAAE
jgi:hypothetical protein